MAFCSGCGSRKEECACGDRCRSRERGGASEGSGGGKEGVENLLKRLAGDFTKTSEDNKNKILGQLKGIQ